jgi:hypothetical protein
MTADTTVIEVTGYGLNDEGFISGSGMYLSTTAAFRPALGATQHPIPSLLR